MRQLATLLDGDRATMFGDYLRTLKIESQVLPDEGGWAVWVCDEDKLAQAREELGTFLQNPTDPRYAGAAKAAKELRQREEREEREFEKRQIDLASQWPGQVGEGRPYLTLILVMGSLGVSLAAGTAFLMGKLSAEARGNPVLQAVLIQSLTPEQILDPGLHEVARGQIWRLVTPIFLHFGPLHLLFNMLMLRDLGSAVEIRRGSVRYLCLVLVLAAASNLGQYYFGSIFKPEEQKVLKLNPLFGGMSGVLYGLFGYVWMKSKLAPEMGLYMHSNTAFYMIAWFFFCMTPALGNVANMAHAVGLVLGVVIGAVPPLLKKMG